MDRAVTEEIPGTDLFIESRSHSGTIKRLRQQNADPLDTIRKLMV